MTLAAYAKSKGMSKEEYNSLKGNIKAIASALLQQIPACKVGNGMYYPINEVIPYNTNAEIKQYILEDMKRQGLETIENGTLYRY